jgi:flagellar hook protein FlgE
MIDSILTAMTGLEGHQRGLKTISHNVANMNTTGFKSSTVDFSDVFTGSGQRDGSSGSGAGLDASRTRLDFRPGGFQETGRDADLAIDGGAFFAVQTAEGEQRFSRAGSFEFDSDGTLVTGADKLKVLARDENGVLSPMKLDNERINPSLATTSISLNGNLSSTDDEHVIDNLTVIDAAGGSHVLKLTFKPQPAPAASGSWNVRVQEGLTEVATGTVRFGLMGLPETDADRFKAEMQLTGNMTLSVEFLLNEGVTSYSSGTTSTLAMKKIDGHASGRVASYSFDDSGKLKISYSNGQSEPGQTLAFAEFSDEAALESVGNGLFKAAAGSSPTFRTAGTGVKLLTKNLEQSNVNLTQEFSSLILMQRGYQASSQVLTTANEMLQQLLELKGRR